MKVSSSILVVILCFLTIVCNAQATFQGSQSLGSLPDPISPDLLEKPTPVNTPVQKKGSTKQSGSFTTFLLTPPPAGSYNLYSDSLALVDLYNSTNGVHWTNKTNWLTGKVSTWYGIVVNTTTQRVTTVQLNANNLIGTIPASIGNLTALTLLRLFDNTQISGSLPASLNNLTQMLIMSIYNNALTGDIPDLSGMTQMQQLRLHQNNLTGNIDWMTSMHNVNTFAINNNPNLTCQLPSAIGNCTKLTALYLYNTKIYGSIPASLNSCIALTQLYLHANNLSGGLTNLGSLVNLTQFYLHFNYGITGSVPPWISNWTKMQILSIGDTGLSGSLPSN